MVKKSRMECKAGWKQVDRLAQPVTLPITYCDLGSGSNRTMVANASVNASTYASLGSGLPAPGTVALGGMYLGHAVSNARFRLNTLRHLVYHYQQGVTARIIHIEDRALEAWKVGAAPWLESGKLHLIVHQNRTFAGLNKGRPSRKYTQFQPGINTLTLHMAKGSVWHSLVG